MTIMTTLDDLEPGWNVEETREIWVTQVDKALATTRLSGSATDFYRYCRPDDHGPVVYWSDVHNEWKNDPERFKRWYALYRLGVTHG